MSDTDIKLPLPEPLRSIGNKWIKYAQEDRDPNDIAFAIWSAIEEAGRAAAEQDKQMLDWLDEVNRKANERNGTKYGWKFDINHNRAALMDHNWPAMSIREAIDDAMKGQS